MPDVGATQRDSQKFIVFTNWEKMNTRLSRVALPENQLAWLENLQPVGQNNLVPVPAADPPLTMLAGETVNLQFFANLTSQPPGPNATSTDYSICFTVAGGAIAVNLDTGAQTVIAPDGTFSANPDMTVYASQRILIADSIAGYCTWDGYAFVTGGGVSPRIVVTNGGSGYTSAPTVTISGGSGSGATAHAIVAGTIITGVPIDSGGSGYTSPPSVQITGGSGKGVQAHALLTPTLVASIVVDNPGSGYTAQPTVTVTDGGGSGCTADVLLTPTTVNSIIVDTPGSAYTSAPAVAFTGGGGSGAAAHAVLGGGIATVVIDAGGSGYTSQPAVAFVASDGGAGAAAHALLVPAHVASFVVDTGGIGYRQPPFATITDGGGSGATATCILSPTRIDIVEVTNGGTGYSHAPTVTFTGGGGTGAAAHAVISGGAVVSVVVDSGGTGYITLPTVHFTGGGGSGAGAIVHFESTSVASLALTAAGSGYTHLPTVSITTTGTGTGATAHAVLTPTSVASLVLDTAGANYTTPPAVTLTSTSGSGAAAHTTILTNTVAAVVIDNAGAGYTTVPTMSFSGGGGSGAAAHAVLTATTVGAINVDIAGSGFTKLPTVNFTGGGGGSGVTAHAVLAPTSVASVHIDNQGSGFLVGDTPTVTFTGGGGSGAAAHVTLGSSFVGTIILDNAGSGYKPGDTLTVTISGGGGTGATATAGVWPVVMANTIAVFAGRVWTANGRALSFTGTAGFDDVNPANAAGTVTFADADLSHTITALRTLNNYLFIFGDQSVRQIGSILIGSGNITLFTPFVLASDIGTSFRNTILSYNRLVLFANKNGVYAIFGASVEKISDDLDGIFAGPSMGGTVHSHIDFSLTPQAALVDLRNIHCYLLLVRYVDPVAGPRAIVLAFQDKEWFVISQGSLVSIVPTFLASSQQWEVFGSSGSDVTLLLQDTTTAVPVKLVTALSPHQNPIQAKQALRAGVAAVTNSEQILTLLIESEYTTRTYAQLLLPYYVVWVNYRNMAVTWVNASGGVVNWAGGGGFRFPYTAVDGLGKFLGATMTANLVDSVINMLAIEYQDRALWGRPA